MVPDRFIILFPARTDTGGQIPYSVHFIPGTDDSLIKSGSVRETSRIYLAIDRLVTLGGLSGEKTVYARNPR